MNEAALDPLLASLDDLPEVCRALGISYAGAWCIRRAQSLACTYAWDPARLGYVLRRVDLDDVFFAHDFAELLPSLHSAVSGVVRPVDAAPGTAELPPTRVVRPTAQRIAQPSRAKAPPAPLQGLLFGGGR